MSKHYGLWNQKRPEKIFEVKTFEIIHWPRSDLNCSLRGHPRSKLVIENLEVFENQNWNCLLIQVTFSQCLKITQNVAFEFFNFPRINFCPIQRDLSGNTVWPPATGFQKLVKMDHSKRNATFCGIFKHCFLKTSFRTFQNESSDL